MAPETTAPSGNSPISASAVIVLPEPELADDAEALAGAKRKRDVVHDAPRPGARGQIDGEIRDFEQHLSAAL